MRNSTLCNICRIYHIVHFEDFLQRDFFVIPLQKFDQKLQYCSRIGSCACTRGSRRCRLYYFTETRDTRDDIPRCDYAKRHSGTSVRAERDLRTELNLTELSSTLELP